MPAIEHPKSQTDPGAAFVTGASGFIGGRLVERLLALGRPVRVLARRPLPHLAARGVEVVAGDLLDAAALARGCAGAGTVFHVAGRVGIWGSAQEFHHVNVDGTQAVLAAARTAGVPRFIYTSSPSVVYTGGDLAGVDESAPLCAAAPCAYPTSKAAAERAVLAANGPGFATVALRPHLVWGPGDRHLVPRIVALARRGRLRIVGAGRNRVDLTHIANVIAAQLLAESTLCPDICHVLRDKPPGGRAYFITNGEPVVLWDWINGLLSALGIPPVTKHVSLRAAAVVGAGCEALWRLLPLRGEPPMTRFAAKELATDHWFRIDAARRDLGYHPDVSMAAGTADLVALLRSGQKTAGGK
jgi:nucleoside-diphosphate-sugar epimerase